MAPGSRRRSVVLLHDQLLDARIWVTLSRLVAVDATVQTLSVPPLHVLGPAAWAEHIEHHARAAISPGAVDLAVTVGGAAGAGIGLVSDGCARAALLLDPDLEALIDHLEGSMRTMLAEPDVTDKLTQFFHRLGPDTIEELAIRGTLSDEGIHTLVDASLKNDAHLTRHDRALLRRIGIEQLTATLPLDLEAQRRGSPERPDWIARLAPVAHRCTVATSASPLYRRLDFDAALRSRVPGAQIVHLTSPSSSAWTSTPHEIAALIHELLQG